MSFRLTCSSSSSSSNLEREEEKMEPDSDCCKLGIRVKEKNVLEWDQKEEKNPKD